MNIPEFNEIVEPNDQTEARREHLDKLRELIGNTYPNKYERSKITGKEDTISNILAFAPVASLAKELKDATPTGEKPDQELKAALNEKLKAFGDVRISGRLAVPPRVMGKAAFVHLSDGKNRLQIYVRKQDAKIVSNDTGELLEGDETAWDFFKLLDHGDFVGASGFLFLTNTGELSVHVETLQFLSKALVPMPDKMHGISDPELQRRYRYADLIASSLQIEHEGLTTREVFERRAKLISGMRRFLDDHGYIEVETPMLTPKATGAAATPFETHHNALDIPLYARIAPELYLKRLTVGGFEKVYELNRNFRNEGLSHKHNPEFTMLEFYCAYMDVNNMMDFAEAMLKESVQKATGGSLQVKISEQEEPIDFDNFERWTMKKAIVEMFPKYALPEFTAEWLEDSLTVVKLLEWSRWCSNSLRKVMVAPQEFDGNIYGIQDTELADKEKEGYKKVAQLRMLPHGAGEMTWKRINFDYKSKDVRNISEIEVSKAIVSIFENIAEYKLIQPTFITDYPKSISPLSKASPENPQIAERFELFINGMECANGFSELNDPQEQYERFVDQMKEREGGDAEAMVLDEDYIRALAYGMPPAAGIGIGIDRLVMLLTNKHSIRDVILFPHMRPEKKENEKMNETNEAAEQAALTTAEKWLALIDKDEEEESWNQAASMFKTALTVGQWKEALDAAHFPIGKVVSRKLKSKKYAKELPGAPDGEYVVIEYESAFEKKKNGTETVVPMKDTDGEWRVSGYFIK